MAVAFSCSGDTEPSYAIQSAFRIPETNAGTCYIFIFSSGTKVYKKMFPRMKFCPYSHITEQNSLKFSGDIFHKKY